MNENWWYESVLHWLKKKLEQKVRSIFVLKEEEKQDLIDLIDMVEDVDLLYSIDEKINEILKKVSSIAADMIDDFDEEKLSTFKNNITNDLLDISKKEQDDLMWAVWIDFDKHINI